MYFRVFFDRKYIISFSINHNNMSKNKISTKLLYKIRSESFIWAHI